MAIVADWETTEMVMGKMGMVAARAQARKSSYGVVVERFRKTVDYQMMDVM